MALVLVTGPTSEPVTLAECKQHLRLTFDDDDNYVAQLIAAAREHVETFTRRTLLTTTWRLTLDYFPSVLYLPRPPLASVTSIVYTDAAGSAQTLSASLYTVDTDSEPGRVQPAYGQVWPSTRDDMNAVKVTYVAGWTTAASVPEPIKTAIMQLVGRWYEHRESVITGTISTELPQGARYLLQSCRATTYP